MSDRTFEYLLNAMERASQEENPAQHRYGAKRKAVLAYVAALEVDRKHLYEARDLLDELADEEPCRFDHHGHCQEHGWTDTVIGCPHPRAVRLANQISAAEDARTAESSRG